jgi:hypothetical protein
MKLPLMGGVGPAAETSSHLTPPSSGESRANLNFNGESHQVKTVGVFADGGYASVKLMLRASGGCLSVIMEPNPHAKLEL